MTKWIRAMTDIGMTRIRMDAVCAYQSIDNDGGDSNSLLIYTSETPCSKSSRISMNWLARDSAFEFHN